MKKHDPRLAAVLTGILILLFSVATGAGESPEGAAGLDGPAGLAYVEEIQRWQAAREEGLRRETGWLAVVGLVWLAPGENSLGSATDSAVVVPGGKGPARAGVFVLHDDGVTIVPETRELLLDGKPVTRRRLRADMDGSPHILTLGSLRLKVIRRGQRFGVRMKDPEAPQRLEFAGIEEFPIDPAWRVEGHWEAYAELQQRQVPTVTGTPAEMVAPGRVHFSLAGHEMTLEPVLDSADDPELLFIFKDQTTGHETYGGGRFLYSARPEDGRILLDFNKAYNPPCAFTPYATCPLPLPGNALPVRVEAGEKSYGTH